jgi:hypothetical protein
VRRIQEDLTACMSQGTQVASRCSVYVNRIQVMLKLLEGYIQPAQAVIERNRNGLLNCAVCHCDAALGAAS